MSEKKKRPRLRHFLLCVAELVLLIGPLLGVLIANKDRYFTTVAETVKLSIGGSICVVFMVLLIFGKLRVPGSMFFITFVFVMSWLLGPLLEDLMLLSGVAMASKAVDLVLVTPRIRALREQITIGKTANATTKQVEEVLQKYLGRV